MIIITEPLRMIGRFDLIKTPKNHLSNRTKNGVVGEQYI